MITISFLGIDGSGKSTLIGLLGDELDRRGYDVTVVPFHKWLFADRLKGAFGKGVDIDREAVAQPYAPQPYSLAAFVKPIIAFFDNYFMYINRLPSNRENGYFIFDRFICATQIKFKALNYRVEWFRPVWSSFRTDYGFVIDIPIDTSIRRQSERDDPYVYSADQLSIEKNEYLQIATKHGYDIINGEHDINNNLKKILNILSI